VIARSLIVQVVLFSLRDDALQVLLVPDLSGLVPDLSGLVPREGAGWQLPGQELHPDEGLEEAANRLLGGLLERREAYLEQLYTYGSAQSPAVRVVYFALVPADRLQAPGGLAHWFPRAALPDPGPEGAEILAYALRRLRYKLEYSAVGFQLLPEEFSLSELQHTYEVILGEKLDKRNFRRRMLLSGIIEPTVHKRLGEGRPARLYRYRPDAVAEVKVRRLFP